MSSCITPCGTYVIASGQDGAVYMWNADNGALVHVYDKPLGDVDSSFVVNRFEFCGRKWKIIGHV